MKRTLLLMMVLLSLQMHGQEAQKTKQNSVRLEMISAVQNKFAFHLERYKNQHSFVLNMGVSLSETPDGKEVFEAYPEYRYYYQDKVLGGWYIGPHLRYKKTSEKNYYQVKSYGLGFNFGYQFNLAKGIIIDLYFGPEYALGDVKLGDRVHEVGDDAYYYQEVSGGYPHSFGIPKYEGAFINGGIALGIAF